MKRFFTLVVFLIFSFSCFSQSEIGVLAGGSLFKGDVNRIFAFKETKPSIGIFYRLYAAKFFSIRSNFCFTTLSGSDARDESYSDRDINIKFRNLHFRSKVIEFNVIGEFFFRPLAKSSPYTFAGGGFFYFNPQAAYQGKWYDLQPLGTEGQGLSPMNPKYDRLQKNITIGIGWKYKINPRYTIAFEIGYRKTFTDYIDDVSGTYYDKAQLYQKNGTLSAIFSDRSGELVNNAYNNDFVANQGGYITDPYSDSGYRISGYGTAGDVRGNSKNKDNYIIYSFTFSRFLGKLDIYL